MDQIQQDHSGSGDNIGRDKHIHIYPAPEKLPSKYLNAFAHYDLANLVGRESQLEAIKNHFKNHQLLLLHGIGGIGKTTLAKAYISKAKDQYEHIAYIEVVGSLAQSMLIKLADSSDISIQTDLSAEPEVKFKALIECLRHIPGLLLVLDNVNDPDDLDKRKKQLASLNAHVLITSRARPQLFQHERLIQEVDALRLEEALILFKHFYTTTLTELDQLLVERILKDAFYHPKLVEIIAKATQANAFISLDKLGQIVGEKYYKDEEINYPINIDDQTKKIYRVLLDLFDTDCLTDDAQKLLRYFAVLPSIDVPVESLASLLSIEATSDRQALLGTLNNLVHTGWLEDFNNRFFSMHGLVQWVIQQRLLPSSVNCEPLIKGMTNVLSYQATESPLSRQTYLRYTIEWLSLFGGEQQGNLALCFMSIGSIHMASGDYQQALAFDQKALAISKAILTSHHPILAQCYHNVGATCITMGHYQQAFDYVQQSISIRQVALSPNHPDLGESYSNMGAIYEGIGDHQQALNYHNKALTLFKVALPPNHPYLANTYTNMGIVYGNLGDYQQALAYIQKGVAINEKILSPNHPGLAKSYTNLAECHGVLGDFHKALAYHHKVLVIREAVLPTTHPDLIRTYGNLSKAYYYLEDLEQSNIYKQKAMINE